MGKICVFAGTSEGREFVEKMSLYPIEITACVATEYGESLIDEEKANVHLGRMDKEQMVEFFINEKFDLVVDCTHPYAQIVTENICEACVNLGLEYLRVNRDTFYENSCIECENISQAVEYLRNTKGNILSTIGSKELIHFENCGFEERLFARVLPLDMSLQACKKANIKPANIIAMQGPFSYELNKAMINSFDIKVLLTKDSGKAGGFDEKQKIAQDMGLELVVVKKPEQKTGVSLNEAENIIKEKFNIKEKQKIFVIASGVGSLDLMNKRAKETIRNCDVIIGTKRLTDEMSVFGKKSYNEIYGDKIREYVDLHPEYKNIAIVFTGDIGFYSGAKKLYSYFDDMDIETICGISSPIYLASKLKMPWEDIKLVSLHGREKNIVSFVQRNHKVFTLLDAKNTVSKVAELLVKYNINAKICVGENLSYPNEKITIGTAQELINSEFNTLSCAIIINENFDDTLNFGIEDENFERIEKVPMTKSEVRAVTISKLKLTKDAVIYDVGAGTGSVSVEMALNSPQGIVYAIEKNPTALEAIEKNKIKFKTDNLQIIDGFAPDCLADLPAPSHVFIGGSSGNLKEIVNLVLVKNPNARFVLNTVTLETLSEAMEVIKDFEDKDVIEISSSRAKKLGKYNLMMANNPIYIISFQKEV